MSAHNGPCLRSKIQSLNVCTGYQSNGRSSRMLFYRGPYHEFMATDLATHDTPDLIIAFTSGHADSDIDLWAPTLERILASDRPAVSITYNKKEAVEEEAALDKLGASFMMRPQINKWRSLNWSPELFGNKYEKH